MRGVSPSSMPAGPTSAALSSIFATLQAHQAVRHPYEAHLPPRTGTQAHPFLRRYPIEELSKVIKQSHKVTPPKQF